MVEGMKVIGIIGYGVVGKAAEATLIKKYEVIKYDKYQTYDSFESLINSDFIFITVSTPFDYKNKELDDSAIIESLEKLKHMKFDKTVIIKSTLVPGFCEKYEKLFNLKIVFHPSG